MNDKSLSFSTNAECEGHLLFVSAVYSYGYKQLNDIISAVRTCDAKNERLIHNPVLVEHAKPEPCKQLFYYFIIIVLKPFFFTNLGLLWVYCIVKSFCKIQMFTYIFLLYHGSLEFNCGYVFAWKGVRLQCSNLQISWKFLMVSSTSENISLV